MNSCNHNYQPGKTTSGTPIRICVDCGEVDLDPETFCDDADFEGDEVELSLDTCTKCGRVYDEIDQEFQACSKCGWVEENQMYKSPRVPTENDFLSGEADILTGRWR